ncbi:MAG: hypothetical protein QM724_02550 [Flavobacteriales bacterium]
MRTVARLFTAVLTATLLLGQLSAAEPFRFTGSSAAPAASLATGNSSALEHQLSRQLDRYVIYPIMNGQQDLYGDVVVSFVINTEGHVEVIAATASDERLADYVLSRLSKVDVGRNPEGVWRTSHVRFRFRPQA